MFKEDASTSQLLDPTRCEHCRTLRYDSNVLVLQRLHELATMASVNLILAIACVMYLGSTLVCLIYTLSPGTASDAIFHHLEFGGTFVFTLVTTFALIFSPERRFRSPLLLKVLVLINVCASFVAALLVFLSLKSFEKLAHEIEYANELCTAVVDVLIVLTLDPADGQMFWRRWQTLATCTLAVSVPIAQLTVYNASSQSWGGETPARYVEFIFNGISACVSFWFCSDSMFTADRLKLEIMIAPTELTVVIDAKSRRAVHNHGSYIPPSPLSAAGNGPAIPALPAGQLSPPCGGCDDCANCRAADAGPELGWRVSQGILPLPPDMATATRAQEQAPLCVPCD